MLFIIYLFIEIYLIVIFVDEFGILMLFLEIFISALLGIGILASQYKVMIESFNSIFVIKEGIGNFIGRNFFRIIGGLCLIIPGILSDIVGLGFFIISFFFLIKKTKLQDEDIFSQEFYNFDNFSKTREDSEIIDVEIIENIKNDKKE